MYSESNITVIWLREDRHKFATVSDWAGKQAHFPSGAPNVGMSHHYRCNTNIN